MCCEETQMTYLLLLNIDLYKFNIRELVLHLGKVRRDESTWSAPSSPIIDDDYSGATNLPWKMEVRNGICPGSLLHSPRIETLHGIR